MNQQNQNDEDDMYQQRLNTFIESISTLSNQITFNFNEIIKHDDSIMFNLNLIDDLKYNLQDDDIDDVLSNYQVCIDSSSSKLLLANQSIKLLDYHINRLNDQLLPPIKCFPLPIKRIRKSNKSTIDTLYCTCRQISFGEMIACDADSCLIEWFHYDCVGLKEPPSGPWYCTDCSNER